MVAITSVQAFVSRKSADNFSEPLLVEILVFGESLECGLVASRENDLIHILFAEDVSMSLFNGRVPFPVFERVLSFFD